MNNGEEMNGSGEFQSDLDSESEDADVDDIPVTGFAVASSKRNADFHELFPAVPEADYLIEGELLFVLAHMQPSYRSSERLWVCITERNPCSRSTIHLRESHLF